MITFLSVVTAITLTEAFGAGALLGLGIYNTVRNKRKPKKRTK